MHNLSTRLWSHIRVVQDFPKSGQCFFDLTPLFSSNISFLTDAFIERIPAEQLAAVDCFMAVETRGFAIASLLAQRLDKGLILVRKAGKLPPPVIGIGSSLDYGKDRLEISAQIKAQNVMIIDDILATGNTLNAVKQLAEKAQHHVLGASILLNLSSDHSNLNTNIWSILDEKSRPKLKVA
ncbi:adenine phosphoribosyltransferase [Acinetobacter sp. ANC 4558]|uniref:adenine phosphoribosyltransferase n=1 Tax=Acinetobacter sp. ANC 4558 TaxID=1977876 RepID=UPI000A35ACEF|nr:adenine phosphoribosyltransferase [Acinetobacter sp. ANC 4558]OTG87575.1 adenine phosphoribosyltransferase [Acinetobacter sp. ANC 4558]